MRLLRELWRELRVVEEPGNREGGREGGRGREGGKERKEGIESVRGRQGGVVEEVLEG